MQVLSASEILNLPSVASAVRSVSHMHRAMHISRKVNEKLECECLTLLVQFPALEGGNLLLYGSDHVSVLVEHRIFEGLIGVDILVMPCARVSELRSVAGIVHPICPIDDRFPVQNLRDLFFCLLCQVLLGNRAGHVMPFLPPRVTIHGRCEQSRSKAGQLQ